MSRNQTRRALIIATALASAALSLACFDTLVIKPSAVVPNVDVASASAPLPPPVVCWTMPPYGGNDAKPPTGGCFGPGRTRAEIDAAIAAREQGTWGLSGRAVAWPEQLPDGTWHIAVTK